MNTVQDRDNLLHSLYKDKKYYVFFYGQEYFDNKVRDIHRKWVNGYGMFANTFGNDMVVEQICWENDYGYLEVEE